MRAPINVKPKPMNAAQSGGSSSLLKEAAHFIQQKIGRNFKPDLLIIAGSGLGALLDKMKRRGALPFRGIPGFIPPAVAGHKGELLAGELNRKKILFLSGRTHFYEGYSMEQVTFPIRVMAHLGVPVAIVTSAVGSMNRKFRVGDIAVIEDHINFMGENPLRSIFGDRFLDMSGCYSSRLKNMALNIAGKKKIRAFAGTYFAVSGPSYETPSEVRAFRKLGGDVVGMSLAPESMAAHLLGMEVLAFSYVSNSAAGLSKKSLAHGEVLKAGRDGAEKISKLIEELTKLL